MEDILSKVQEILADPKKLAGFKNLASSLLNNSGEEEKDKKDDNSDIESILKDFVDKNKENNEKNINKDKFNMDLNMDMVFKLKNAMEIMNKDDKNIVFLRSLKELLADERQQKVDNAIKIMRLIKLLPIIKEFDILKDFKII